MGEWIYRSIIFLTLPLVGGEWSASRPGRFTPGTHWIGLDDVEKRKFFTLPGLKLFHPVASRYTDYAIPAPSHSGGYVEFCLLGYNAV
jgi:hypothetical protein